MPWVQKSEKLVALELEEEEKEEEEYKNLELEDEDILSFIYLAFSSIMSFVVLFFWNLKISL